MNVTRRAFPAVMAGAIPLALVRTSREEDGDINRPDERFLQTKLAPLLDVTAVPGLAIGLVRGGRTVWERYQGVVEAGTKRHVTADTLFPAASLGKPVFAYAVLRLVEQGKLDLDRPLKTYVPDHAPVDSRGDRITARHVLTHTSGLRNWRHATDQQLVPEFEPGSRFLYSGEGFYYLQRVVERVAGCAVQTFMEEALFQRFNMASSTYAWRPDTDGRLAYGHNRGVVSRGSREFAARLAAYATSQQKAMAALTHDEIIAAMTTLKPAPPPLPNFIPTNVASSLMTTVQDYCTFLGKVLAPGGGPGELGAPLRLQMLEPQIRLNHALAWGLGWGVETISGREYLWHWGDNGTFKNFVLAHVPSRSALVVFTNGTHGMRLAEALVDAATSSRHLAFDWI